MAATPVFAASPKVGFIQLGLSDSTNVSAAAVTGASTGTRIREIRVVSGPTTAPGASATKLIVYLDNGGTSRRIDTISLTNAVDTLQGVSVYSNLLLPGTGHTIKFSLNGALASGSTLDCVVIGEDF